MSLSIFRCTAFSPFVVCGPAPRCVLRNHSCQRTALLEQPVVSASLSDCGIDRAWCFITTVLPSPSFFPFLSAHFAFPQFTKARTVAPLGLQLTGDFQQSAGLIPRQAHHIFDLIRYHGFRQQRQRLHHGPQARCVHALPFSRSRTRSWPRGSAPGCMLHSSSRHSCSWKRPADPMHVCGTQRPASAPTRPPPAAPASRSTPTRASPASSTPAASTWSCATSRYAFGTRLRDAWGEIAW